MGNVLPKGSPSIGNKHTMLNNSQLSETAERSLLNTTDDNAGTMLINDPRSPTEGINRTPIQVAARSKGLFRGMFSGRKPPETVENGANSNAAANVEDERAPIQNGKNHHETVSVTASAVSPTSTSTPLNEKSEERPTTNGFHHKNGEVPTEVVSNGKSNGEVVPASVVIDEDVQNESQATTDHDVTTENEEAFIVVDNKKKKKKREKAEAAKAKAEAESKMVEKEEKEHHNGQLEVVKKQPLTKGYSDSKLDSKQDETEKNGNGDVKSDALNKPRLSNANENDLPSSFRIKVEKACRSLTNLSSKSKTVAVNGNGKLPNGTGSQESGDSAESNNNNNNADNSQEPCTTGVSAPCTTTSPLVDIVNDNVDCNGNSNGKYMVLVNDE